MVPINHEFKISLSTQNSLPVSHLRGNKAALSYAQNSSSSLDASSGNCLSRLLKNFMSLVSSFWQWLTGFCSRNSSSDSSSVSQGSANPQIDTRLVINDIQGECLNFLDNANGTIGTVLDRWKKMDTLVKLLWDTSVTKVQFLKLIEKQRNLKAEYMNLYKQSNSSIEQWTGLRRKIQEASSDLEPIVQMKLDHETLSQLPKAPNS